MWCYCRHAFLKKFVGFLMNLFQERRWYYSQQNFRWTILRLWNHFRASFSYFNYGTFKNLNLNSRKCRQELHIIEIINEAKFSGVAKVFEPRIQTKVLRPFVWNLALFFLFFELFEVDFLIIFRLHMGQMPHVDPFLSLLHHWLSSLTFKRSET